MASVFNTSAQGTTSETGNRGIAAASGGDDVSELFTTLLVAQIRNQNPLDPVDPSEFVGQLTQLSQTETLQKLLAQSTATASILDSLQVMTLGAQVGSEMRVNSSSVTLAAEAVRGSFSLASGSAETAVVLGAGSQRYRVELGPRDIGDVNFEIDPSALGIPAGTYAMWVESESGGRNVAIDVFGTLRSVRLSASGGLTLNVANVGDVSAAAISGFNARVTQ